MFLIEFQIYQKHEVFSILISDLHIGSKFFMEKEFQSFLEWLNGNDRDR